MAFPAQLSADSLTRLSTMIEELPAGKSYVIGAAVLRLSPSDPKLPQLLILKRSPHESAYPNVWEIPGGKVDHGETVHDFVVRETKEEAGLTVTKIVGELGEMRWVGGSGKESVQWNHIVQVKDGEEVKTCFEEHEIYDWVVEGEWVE